MKELPIVELYLMKNRLIKENMSDDFLMSEVLEAISEKEKMIFEDSATGGPAVSGGMGAVVSAQPSSLAGSTVTGSWSDGGGTVGSGDISVPYSGGGMMSQKIPAMGYNHGSRTGKKTRGKRMTIKSMKDIFSKKQDFTKGSEKKSKVMSFDDFAKADVNKIKK